jgi:hypothetical protein
MRMTVTNQNYFQEEMKSKFISERGQSLRRDRLMEAYFEVDDDDDDDDGGLFWRMLVTFQFGTFPSPV